MAADAPDCVIVQPISETGLSLLREAGLQLHLAPSPDFAAMAPALSTALAVITRNAGFPASAVALAPRLVVIGSHGTGMDTIDRAAAEARGIAVVNTPGANAHSVAELTMGLLLAASRRLKEADAAVRTGDRGFRTRQGGLELHGLTLGLVGFGHVARAVAPIARAFGMVVIGFSRHADAAAMATVGVRKAADLAALLREADVVSLHAAGGGGCLIDAAAIGRMKTGAILVNTARGSLVDEAALAAALHAGHLGAAALDVTATEPLPAESLLLAAPRLLLSPHIGGSTAAALDRTAAAVARRVIAALDARGLIRKSL